MPVKVEDCTGRVKDIQKIVELITENVYVSITGMPGIGKSTIMKEVCHFIYEWNFVRDGALFLFLNELDWLSMGVIIDVNWTLLSEFIFNKL